MLITIKLYIYYRQIGPSEARYKVNCPATSDLGGTCDDWIFETKKHAGNRDLILHVLNNPHIAALLSNLSYALLNNKIFKIILYIY